VLSKKIVKNTAIAFTIAGIIFSPTAYAELGDQTLKKGMTHEDIKTLQQNLKDLGFFNSDDLTTYYGDYTEEAVIEFQKSVELEANGIFDRATYEALVKALKIKEAGEIEKYTLKFDRALKMGARGDDVKALQEVLKALGFLKIENCTDYFGKQTDEALRAFQEHHGLEVDGSAGPKTVEALNRQIIKKGLKVTMPNRSSLGRQELGDKIIETAKKYLGVSYRYGGTSSKGFDCSGYTQFIYKQHNISLPHSTTEQAKVGTKVSKSDLRTGDLVVFSNTYRRGPSHVGIYIANGKFIHASTSRGVVIDDINSRYYSRHFSYGRRIF